jgi:hypothetical protein
MDLVSGRAALVTTARRQSWNVFDCKVSAVMSGLRRLSRERGREPSFLSPRVPSELNFGAFCLVVFAALAIVVTLMFPEAQLASAELLIGP